MLASGLVLVALLPLFRAGMRQCAATVSAGAERQAGQTSGATAFQLPNLSGNWTMDAAQDGVPAPELRERRQGRKGGVEHLALMRTTWGDKDGGTWVDPPPGTASWERMATTAAEACALRCSFLL